MMLARERDKSALLIVGNVIGATTPGRFAGWGLGEMVENGGLPPQLGDRATAGFAARSERREDTAMEARIARPTPSRDLAGQLRVAEYAVTAIGTLGGDESGAVALNAAGQVAGTTTNANGNVRPFRWWHGVISALSAPFQNSVCG
jgi:hypothetical protein